MMKTFNQFVNEKKQNTSTEFTKPGQQGDIYFSKREGNAIGIRLLTDASGFQGSGDVLQMLSTFQGKASLGRVQKSDKRWENMGPASERLLIDLSMKNLGGLATRETQMERGKLLYKFVRSLEESVNESSDYDKYALKMYGKKWDDLDRDKQSEVVDAVEGNYPLSKIKRVKESVNEGSILVWDEMEGPFKDLKNALDKVSKKNTDPKWSKALLSIWNQIEKAETNLNNYDRKLGVITTQE